MKLRCTECEWEGESDDDGVHLDGKDGERPWIACPDCGTWLFQLPEPTQASPVGDGFQKLFWRCLDCLDDAQVKHGRASTVKVKLIKDLRSALILLAGDGGALPLAEESARKSGWTLDFKWLQKIQHDLTYSEEEGCASLETIEAILLAAQSALRSPGSGLQRDAGTLLEDLRALLTSHANDRLASWSWETQISAIISKHEARRFPLPAEGGVKP